MEGQFCLRAASIIIVSDDFCILIAGKHLRGSGMTASHGTGVFKSEGERDRGTENKNSFLLKEYIITKSNLCNIIHRPLCVSI